MQFFLAKQCMSQIGLKLGLNPAYVESFNFDNYYCVYILSTGYEATISISHNCDKPENQVKKILVGRYYRFFQFRIYFFLVIWYHVSIQYNSKSHNLTSCSLHAVISKQMAGINVIASIWQGRLCLVSNIVYIYMYTCGHPGIFY